MRLNVLLTIFALQFSSVGWTEERDIQEGDTLWSIAAEVYGNPWYWPCIWKANANISNPDIISPSQKITLIEKSQCEVSKKAEKEVIKSIEAIHVKSEKKIPTEIPAYLLSKKGGEVVVFRNNRYESIPVKLLIQQEKLKITEFGDKTMGDGVIVEGQLFKKLMPKDPRLGAGR